MDQADCDDARMLEAELTMVEGEVAQEVRDDYAQITTSAGCPGYDAGD